MFVNPEFEYDENQYYFGFSFSSIIKKVPSYGLKYLLAILNSTFAKKWFNTHGKQRGAGVDIGVKKLRLFPIKKANETIQKTIEGLVDFTRAYRGLKDKNSKIIERIEHLIDAMVYELYFPEEINAVDAEVLKHLNNLPELKDDWSDEKKMNTIEKVFQELSDPKHPVTIAMERQKSVKEVRVIMDTN